MMVVFDEEPRQRTHIEIIPMIDVMMFLMVFFVMISLNVIPLSGLKTQLPQAQSTQRLDLAKHLVITIGGEGEIEVEGKRYQPSALPVVLRQQMQSHPKLDVVLNGDKSARVEDLVRVMDIVRTVGVQHVAIATKQAQ
ncbi:MAG: biopolymer transporter ExbD [Sulfurimicrobium sp.]|nr:biopolymer transporter ExbD [Sulfurimicrobium sp.]